MHTPAVENSFSLRARKILIIEDNYDDVELLNFQLEMLGSERPTLEHCDNLASGLIRLALGDIDIVLLDLSLPDAKGIDTVARLRTAAPGTPVLVLTGTDDSTLAVKTISHGAQDYLIKGQLELSLLCRSINYAIERHAVAESAQRLAAIVNCTDDAVISKTLSGTITSWNRGAERLFGYTREEATGKSITMIIPDNQPQELPMILETLSNGESIRNRETVRVKKNGELVDVSMTISPIKVDGTVTGGATIDRDITPRKRAEKVLRETEQRLSMALEAASVGVWDLDLVSGKVWRSLKHDQIFGHTSQQSDWNFETFLSYVVPEDRALVTEVFEEGVRNGQYELNCRITRADNVIRWICARGESYLDDIGTPIRMMGTVVDVTEHKEQEAQRRMIAVMQEREDFMATLTHDMKNPLIGINRLLELLVLGRLGHLTPQQLDLLKSMRDSNVEVLALIQNLMEVYRMESQPNALKFAETNLSSLVNISVNKMAPFAKLRGIDLESEVADNVIATNSDHVALERVLHNLLGNSMKFTPAEGSIKLRLSSSDGFAVIEVEDNGPGIKAEEQSKLFTRFAQGDVGKRYVGGSGLGLYLCKKICDAHGGTIVCDSKENVGTTFRMRIPLKVAQRESA